MWFYGKDQMQGPAVSGCPAVAVVAPQLPSAFFGQPFTTTLATRRSATAVCRTTPSLALWAQNLDKNSISRFSGTIGTRSQVFRAC